MFNLRRILIFCVADYLSGINIHTHVSRILHLNNQPTLDSIDDMYFLSSVIYVVGILDTTVLKRYFYTHKPTFICKRDEDFNVHKTPVALRIIPLLCL